MEPHEMTEAAEQAERAREQAIFNAGVRAEGARLRPLLERCEKMLGLAAFASPDALVFIDCERLRDLLADLRRELGKSEE